MGGESYYFCGTTHSKDCGFQSRFNYLLSNPEGYEIQHLEGAPMHDYLEFEIKHKSEIDAFLNYCAPNFKNLFGGEIWIGSGHIGSRTLTIKDSEATTAKEDGEGSSKEKKGKAEVSEKPKPSFNSILDFFGVLWVNYQGQRLNKMLKLQRFQLKDKETYWDAYHPL